MEDVNQKIASLQEEIKLIESFDPKHTICSANYILELGMKEGKLSIAYKDADGHWVVKRDMDAPEHLSAQGNVYYFDGWYFNRRIMTKEEKKMQAFNSTRLWCKIEGLSGVSRPYDVDGLLNQIVITPLKIDTFQDLYEKATGHFVLDFILSEENFEGHPTENVSGLLDLIETNATAPIETWKKHLDEQIVNLKCSELSAKDAVIYRVKRLILEADDWQHTTKKRKDLVISEAIFLGMMVILAIITIICEICDI